MKLKCQTVDKAYGENQDWKNARELGFIKEKHPLDASMHVLATDDYTSIVKEIVDTGGSNFLKIYQWYLLLDNIRIPDSNKKVDIVYLYILFVSKEKPHKYSLLEKAAAISVEESDWITKLIETNLKEFEEKHDEGEFLLNLSLITGEMQKTYDNHGENDLLYTSQEVCRIY